MFATDEQIKASIDHLQGIKQAMAAGKIARNEEDMKGNKPKLMFSERTADELLEAVRTIQVIRADAERYRKALKEIVCLNMPMPDEVFRIANGALEEWITK